jgi:hypothetical protein
MQRSAVARTLFGYQCFFLEPTDLIFVDCNFSQCQYYLSEFRRNQKGFQAVFLVFVGLEESRSRSTALPASGIHCLDAAKNAQTGLPRRLYGSYWHPSIQIKSINSTLCLFQVINFTQLKCIARF